MDMKDIQDSVELSGPVRIGIDALREGVEEVAGLPFSDNQVILFALMYTPFRFDEQPHNTAYIKALSICLADPCELEEDYLKNNE
jgi:hypothetical protein